MFYTYLVDIDIWDSVLVHRNSVQKILKKKKDERGAYTRNIVYMKILLLKYNRFL